MFYTNTHFHWWIVALSLPVSRNNNDIIMLIRRFTLRFYKQLNEPFNSVHFCRASRVITLKITIAHSLYQIHTPNDRKYIPTVLYYHTICNCIGIGTANLCAESKYGICKIIQPPHIAVGLVNGCYTV